MSKLSSRLQSRIAKRRNVLHFREEERRLLKSLVKAGELLFGFGMLQQALLDDTRQRYREVREIVRGMAEDQTLDKVLLRQQYELEYTSYSLDNAGITPDFKTLILDIETFAGKL